MKSSQELYVCLKTNYVWPVTFCLKNKESDWRATTTRNITEVQLKKNIGFVCCEAVIFELLKTSVHLALAYLLVVRAGFFAICRCLTPILSHNVTHHAKAIAHAKSSLWVKH